MPYAVDLLRGRGCYTAGNVTKGFSLATRTARAAAAGVSCLLSAAGASADAGEIARSSSSGTVFSLEGPEGWEQLPTDCAAGCELDLPAGRYRLRGYHSSTNLGVRSFTVGEGQQVTIAPPRDPARRKRGKIFATWGAVGVAVGIPVTVFGIIWGALSSIDLFGSCAEARKWDGEDPSDCNRPGTGPTLTVAGGLLLTGGGAALLGTGIYEMRKNRIQVRVEPRSSSAPPLALAPWIAPSAGGLRVLARF